MDLRVRKEILGMEPYNAGKPVEVLKKELSIEEFIRLGANENPLGCSPNAKKAMEKILHETMWYPQGGNLDLIKALSEHLGVKESQIFCGNGSDSLIRVLCEVFIGQGDESIMGEITFPRYKSATDLLGGKSIIIPMKNHGLDLQAMVSSITHKTKLIWLCNPNNPTGIIFKKGELEDILKKIPQHILVVMDEAYKEYVEDEDYPNTIDYLDKYPNIICIRTFSKAYGLAGLRVGYGIANEKIVDYINRVLGPFDVNSFAQAAAIQCLKDEEHLCKVVKQNKKGKEYLYKEFHNLSLEYVKTNTNFIMVNTKKDTKILVSQLIKEGIMVRPGHLFEMTGWLRVTIGTMEQNEKFIGALKKYI